jgi:hypothetical protein
MRNFIMAVLLTAAACSGSSDSEDLGTQGGAGGAPSGPPADVAGKYSVGVTNRENGCGFDNWKANDTSTNIPFEVTQSGSQVTGTIDGLTGGLVALWLGSRTFSGTAGGSLVSMTLYGTATKRQNGCAYTINATIEGTLTGDALQGELKYTSKTNGSPNCGSIEGCVTRQEFSGSRPPKG